MSAIRARVRAPGCLLAAAGLVLGLYGLVLISRPAIEERLRARLVRDAAAAGLSATIGSLHVTPRLSLQLGEVLLDDPHRLQIAVRAAELRPRASLGGLLGRSARISFSRVVVRLPRGVELELAGSSWLVDREAQGWRVRRAGRGERFEILYSAAGSGRHLGLRAADARIGDWLAVRLHGAPLAKPGTLDGEGLLEEDPSGDARLQWRGRIRGFALASLASLEGPRDAEVEFGTHTDLELEAEVVVRPRAGALLAERVRLAAGGASAVARLVVEGGLQDPWIDLELEVARLDLARLLATAGVDLAAADLGSAAFSGRVRGRWRAPAALAVTQRLDFTPPARVPPALRRFAGPFVQRVETAEGREVEILVSPESPDFVPLAEVPPLFVRALLLGEDANFYGHRGVDLAELPAAMATNLARGAFVRGGSTLSQQLAKNLFLSRRKTLARKLEEVSLALLLDSALGKTRLLEIYLNVIEWGPGLYGLRPAARHYFGKEPAQLTPKQMAFLVRLIPGPVKYQRSIGSGVPSPFFEGLVTTLLQKLETVGALSPAEYEAALVEPLGLRIGQEGRDRFEPVRSDPTVFEH